MPIATTCPNCAAKFKLNDDLAGKSVKCQKCGGTFTVPSADEEPPTVLKAADDDGIVSNPKSKLPPKVTAAPDSRKRRPSRDDDDDEDESPRDRRTAKKSGGGSTLAIVGILLGGALLGCVGCIGVVGWYIYDAAQKTRREIIAINDKIQKDLKADRFLDQKINPPDGPVFDRKDAPFFDRKDFAIKDKKGPPAPATTVVFNPAGVYTSASQIDGFDAMQAFEFAKLVRHKLYLVQMDATQKYQIDLVAPNFDAFLYLLDSNGKVVARDDDGGEGLNSRIIIQPIMSGQHRIVATSLGGNSTGPFMLTVRRFAPGTDPANAPPALVDLKDLSYRLWSAKFGEGISGTAWAADGKAFFVLKENGVLQRINAATGAVEKSRPLGQNTPGTDTLAMSQEGLVTWLQFKSEVWVIDPDNINDTKKVIAVPGISRVTTGRGNKTALAATFNGDVRVLDLATGQIGQPFSPKVDLRTMTMTSDAKFVFLVNNRKLMRYRYDGQPFILEETGPDAFGFPESINISPDDRYVSVVGSTFPKAPPGHPDRGHYIYAVNNLKSPVVTLKGAIPTKGVGIDTKSNWILVSTGSKGLTLFTMKGDKRNEYDFPGLIGNSVRQIAVSPAGQEALVRSGDRLVHVKLNMQGEPLGRFEAPNPRDERLGADFLAAPRRTE